MGNKKFEVKVSDRRFEVSAEEEGSCRYMVRMRDLDRPCAGRVRVAYLTGRNRSWLAEFFGGKRPSLPALSARAACQSIAEWAVTQPAFAGV